MRIAIIYGGKSVEHDVSLRSVNNLIKQVGILNLQPVLIAINKLGLAYLQDCEAVKRNPYHLSSHIPVFFSPGEGIVTKDGVNLCIDCVFPLIHGTYGEDGCLQGMLEMCQIPYIGENVSTSALCMDKNLMKIVLQQSKINITPYLVIHNSNQNVTYESCVKVLGEPLVIKPVSSGSSYGVNLVDSKKTFEPCIKEAFRFSGKILIEKYIKGREINCALLGFPAIIGELGEIINVKSKIYTYEEKYKLKSNTLQIPANLDGLLAERIKSMALDCYYALGCKSMARIDIFLSDTGELFINEVNTIPAFNEYSIYPRLLGSKGITQPELVLTLINQSIHK